MKAFIAKKIGMTSTIAENGDVAAVTLLSAEPLTVTQLKTKDNDGYSAVQLGTGKSKQNKAQVGHFKTAKTAPAIVREFRLNDSSDQQTEDLKVGDKLTAEVFSVGDIVSVTGTSKGKGFAGTIKRHNFHLGRKTHGGRSYRRPGSIGSMYPQKIFKGKKMAGQYGHVQVTTKNLKVALVDVENNIIGIEGAVPGPRKSIVIIKGGWVMSVDTYTKTGNKATVTTKLDKKVFSVEAKNHDLLKQAYLAYLANGRVNLAVSKKRGEVRGGGRKPWRQKGTGRARFGSSRVPLWRGGGITFGPTGDENYSISMNVKTKRLAIRQALSLAAESNKIKVIEAFAVMDAKTKDMHKFLVKIEAVGKVLCVVGEQNTAKQRATQNIAGLKVVSAKYLNVYDVLNADSIVISQDALQVVSDWLAVPTKITQEPKK